MQSAAFLMRIVAPSEAEDVGIDRTTPRMTGEKIDGENIVSDLRLVLG